MSDWKEGDLVEATKGDRVVRDRIIQGTGAIFKDRLYLGAPSIWTPNTPETYEADGYTLSVIERAPEPLPTVPGHYVSTATPHYDSITLDSDGRSWFKRGLESLDIEDVQARMPLTRLRPEAEVAAEVLGKIRAVAVGDGGYYDHQLTARQLREIAAEFGVTP